MAQVTCCQGKQHGSNPHDLHDNKREPISAGCPLTFSDPTHVLCHTHNFIIVAKFFRDNFHLLLSRY